MKSFFLSLILVPGFVYRLSAGTLTLQGGSPIIRVTFRIRTILLTSLIFAFGAGAQYDITRNFSAVSNISIMKIGASDAL